MQWHKERAKWGGLCPGVARLREGAVRDAPGIILQRRGHVTVGLVEVFPTQGFAKLLPVSCQENLAGARAKPGDVTPLHGGEQRGLGTGMWPSS